MPRGTACKVSGQGHASLTLREKHSLWTQAWARAFALGPVAHS